MSEQVNRFRIVIGIDCAPGTPRPDTYFHKIEELLKFEHADPVKVSMVLGVYTWHIYTEAKESILKDFISSAYKILNDLCVDGYIRGAIQYYERVYTMRGYITRYNSAVEEAREQVSHMLQDNVEGEQELTTETIISTVLHLIHNRSTYEVPKECTEDTLVMIKDLERIIGLTVEEFIEKLRATVNKLLSEYIVQIRQPSDYNVFLQYILSLNMEKCLE